jgi:hypothetical protein
MIATPEAPKVVVVYGGLNTSKKALRKLGKAIIKRSLAAPDAELRLFTLPEASRDPKAAAAAAVGALAVAHSMGNLIWKQMYEDEIELAGAISLNRTKPTKVGKLILGATIRFGHHLARSVSGPYAREHRQIVRDTWLSLRDWNGNLGRVGEVASYDSDKYLGLLAAPKASGTPGIPTAAVINETSDEFTNFREPGTAQDVHYVYDTSPDGCHDTSLVNPEYMAGLVAEQGVFPWVPTPE